MSSGPATNFTNIQMQLSDGDVGQFGGIIKRFNVASTILLGDVVYISAANTVAKSTTNGDYAKFAGVVVGGSSFDVSGSVNTESTLVGQTAAVNGGWVLVMTDGIAFIKSDGAILASSLVIPDASVAGECDVAGANPGWILGVALEAIADGSVGRMLIRHNLDEA